MEKQRENKLSRAFLPELCREMQGGAAGNSCAGLPTTFSQPRAPPAPAIPNHQGAETEKSPF